MAAASALRMVVGTNGVSLLVKNGARILALKSWQLDDKGNGFQAVESNLQKIFGSEELLDLTFESKICALSSPAFTLVPRRLYHPENLDQFFKLLLREGTQRVYDSDKLAEFDCYLVWAAEAGLYEFCSQYFAKQHIQHLGGPLLSSLHQLSPADGYAVFANIRGSKVKVAVFERRNLVLFNSFDFSNPDDLLYYILLIYKQFNLSPNAIPLSLSGTLLEDSEAFKRLHRYFLTLNFLPLPGGFQLPAEQENLPAHYWFDISMI